MRERLLLASVSFFAMAALFLFVVGGSRVLRAAGLDADAAFFVHLAIWVALGCFGMTFLPGAPRWFQREDR